VVSDRVYARNEMAFCRKGFKRKAPSQPGKRQKMASLLTGLFALISREHISTADRSGVPQLKYPRPPSQSDPASLSHKTPPPPYSP